MPIDTFTSTRFHWGDGDYQNGESSAWSQSQIGSGDGKVNFAAVKAFDTFQDLSVVILETGGENSIERWNISPNVSPTSYRIAAVGDEDDKLRAPVDVTVDKNDNVYVLDVLSNGQTRIKKFSPQFVSLGGFGSNTEISGKAIAIDCSDSDNKIHVLHYEGIAIFD